MRRTPARDVTRQRGRCPEHGRHAGERERIGGRRAKEQVGDEARQAECERTADDDGELLTGDGLHLTDAGRRELVLMTTRALGRAPVGSSGTCLPTRYTDDSPN